MHNKNIFREYDVRGKYLIDYDHDFAFKLGRAFYHFCLEESSANHPIKIALGKDARHSSTPLMESLSSGIKSCGGQVLNLGLVTSPVTYFSCYHIENLSGAIMVTGSHNPPEYNGFKISVGKRTLAAHEIQKLSHYVEKYGDSKETSEGTEEHFDIVTPYVERIGSEFNLKPLPFAIDCGNGAAGSVARKTFSACGLNPNILFEKPDGDFPNHHPDPTLEENLIALKKHLKTSKDLFGIGYDGDADRIVVVTKSGKTVYADELMSLYAKFVLKTHPGAEIVGDVKCSDEYYKLLRAWGAKGIMWKTGHSLIKQKVKDLKAPFGGEFSGHIFFNDRFYGFDDAIYCSLRLVEIVQNSNQDLEELLSYYPKTFSSPEIRIEVGEEKKYQLVEVYKNEIHKNPKLLKINETDGVRATFQNGWTLVRVSNTQPAVTLRFEAQTDQDLDELKQEAYNILEL